MAKGQSNEFITVMIEHMSKGFDLAYPSSPAIPSRRLQKESCRSLQQSFANRRAAVHVQGLAGDEAGLFGQEEGHAGREF